MPLKMILGKDRAIAKLIKTQWSRFGPVDQPSVGLWTSLLLTMNMCTRKEVNVSTSITKKNL